PLNRVRIMLPMVSFLQEVTCFKKMIKEECQDLGITEKVQLGLMIEVPAAALVAKQLARESDFFSIGTNDLTQYTLAIDRGHKELSVMSNPLHPAVLQLIAHTCQGAKEAGRPVSVCGAMAAEPEAIPLLIGLGITHLSVSLGAVAQTKAMIRQLNLEQCRQVAQQALQMAETQEVRALVKKQFAIS
ncbi:MAG: phosphoenolpyruvate--protein phosphotransferase, partial [Elusimicrobiaceae bacterium]|nr:phosphoenolpyruvate--protein phosphotransferase [Elusimicrobiaceae bacterium]